MLQYNTKTINLNDTRSSKSQYRKVYLQTLAESNIFANINEKSENGK